MCFFLKAIFLNIFFWEEFARMKLLMGQKIRFSRCYRNISIYPKRIGEREFHKAMKTHVGSGKVDGACHGID